MAQMASTETGMIYSNLEYFFQNAILRADPLMIWGVFSSRRNSKLAFPSTRISSVEYQAIFETNLLPNLNEFPRYNSVFEQDNASAHASSTLFFNGQVNGSPDCIPIENLRGLLTIRVYGESRKFSLADALKKEIDSAWDSIRANTIEMRFGSQCA